MSILIDNKEIGKFSNTSEGVNVLSYKEISEVHDNIYLITTQNNQSFLKECKGTWKSKPIVEFNIHTGSKLFKNVQFVLDQRPTSTINFAKYGVATPKKVLKENQAEPQLVTNKPTPATTATVATSAASLPEDKIKEYIEQSILNLLKSDNSSDQFSKFFDVYTEAFKRDIMQYSEKISRREMYRAMESGGGTNAVQYANGGTIKGNLIIEGNVHADNFTAIDGEIQAGNFVGNTFTGSMSLSGLTQDGAADGQTITWNSASAHWVATTSKRITTIGNGVDSTFTFTHNFNTMNIIHQVYDNVTNEVVLPSIRNLDSNTTEVAFAFVPDSDAYRVITIK